MSEALTGFYQTKYESESHDDTALTFKPVEHPIDRFEGSVSQLLPLVSGRDVLELGAGSGSLVQSLIEAESDFTSWTLTDLSRNRLTGAEQRMGADTRLSFHEVDASEPTAALPGQQFDVLVSIALIEHLIDPIASMIDTRKMLRPGGFIYLDTPNIAKWTRRVKLAMGQFPSTASTQEGLVTYYGKPTALHDEGHLHYFTFAALERLLLERCGFSRVERVPYGTSRKPSPAVAYRLAQRWPTLFSELAILAYA